jgi:hypothetical protein
MGCICFAGYAGRVAFFWNGSPFEKSGNVKSFAGSGCGVLDLSRFCMTSLVFAGIMISERLSDPI